MRCAHKNDHDSPFISPTMNSNGWQTEQMAGRAPNGQRLRRWTNFGKSDFCWIFMTANECCCFSLRNGRATHERSTNWTASRANDERKVRENRREKENNLIPLAVSWRVECHVQHLYTVRGWSFSANRNSHLASASRSFALSSTSGSRKLHETKLLLHSQWAFAPHVTMAWTPSRWRMRIPIFGWISPC